MKIEHKSRSAFVLAACLMHGGMLACVANAQENPLAGPKVTQAASATVLTLIIRDFDGSIEPLTDRPEFAAAALLPLTGEQRAAVEKIETERAKVAASVLRDNYDLILKLVNARQSQDAAGLRELAPKFRTAAKEMMEPVLLDEVASAVGAVHAPQLRGLVKQYNEFTSERERAGRGNGSIQRKQTQEGSDKKSTDVPMGSENEGMKNADGMNQKSSADLSVPRAAAPVERYSVPLRTEVMLCMAEVGRSLRAVVDEGSDKIDDLLKAVNATPEQESKIRLIVSDVGALRAARSPAQRREILKRISAVLTPEQRKLLIQKVRE